MADGTLLRLGRRVQQAAVGAAVILTLAGCTTGPDFERPSAKLPAQWRSAPASAASLAPPLASPSPATPWWTAFGDPVLDRLEDRAAAGNLDVRLALERIVAARSLQSAARAEAAPAATLDAGYSRDRIATADAAAVARPVLGLPAEGPASPKAAAFDLFSVGAGASWELDLWGGKRRLREGARASLEATQADELAVLQSLHAEVARLYLQIRALQAETACTQQQLDLAVAQAGLLEARYAHGLVARADLVEAQSEARRIRSGLVDLHRTQGDAVRALVVLIGGDPSVDPFDLKAPAPAVREISTPLQLPSEVARRRPDILAAEARLHAATAEIGAAEADFYPQITLSGVLSLDAFTLGGLGWDSRSSSFGPSLSFPIFSGGRLKAMLDLRRSEQRSAALAYQQVVLNAWREIEDTLASLDALKRRDPELAADLADRRAKVAMLERSYSHGEIGLAPVVAARAEETGAEIAEIRQRAALTMAEVQLRRQLGG